MYYGGIKLIMLGILLFALMSVSVASAARIDNFAGVQGPGLQMYFGDSVETDNEGTDDPETSISGLVSCNVFFNSVAPVDILINVTNPDNLGTSKYDFFGYVFNYTGVDWSGFQFSLGFGSFDPNYSVDNFTLSSNIDQLDFDTPEGGEVYTERTIIPEFNSQELPTSGYKDNQLTWISVTVISFNSALMHYYIDVPDSELINGTLGSDYQFTLRLTPLVPVPEPATLGTFILGSFVLAACHHRHKH